MSASSMPAPARHAAYTFFERIPYWLLAALLLGVFMAWRIVTDDSYATIFAAVARGIGVTIYVTIVAYAGALVLGLLVGLARVSKNRVIYEVATFYVEIIRGVPMLVLLLYIAFVLAPALVYAVNWLGMQLAGLGALARPLAEFRVRDFDYASRAIIALIIGYSAFLSEIFRAGIESIERGQIEAAQCHAEPEPGQMDGQPEQVDDREFRQRFGHQAARPERESREQRGVHHIGLRVDELQGHAVDEARRGFCAGKAHP